MKVYCPAGTHRPTSKPSTARRLCPCQVKLGISHHTMVDDNIQSEKQLVFVLDNRNLDEGEEKPKKRKKGDPKEKKGPNFKNFGCYIQPNKIKGSAKLLVGWRARQRLAKQVVKFPQYCSTYSSCLLGTYNICIVLILYSFLTSTTSGCCDIAQAGHEDQRNEAPGPYQTDCLCEWHHGHWQCHHSDGVIISSISGFSYQSCRFWSGVSQVLWNEQLLLAVPILLLKKKILLVACVPNCGWLR